MGFRRENRKASLRSCVLSIGVITRVLKKKQSSCPFISRFFEKTRGDASYFVWLAQRQTLTPSTAHSNISLLDSRFGWRRAVIASDLRRCSTASLHSYQFLCLYDPPIQNQLPSRHWSILFCGSLSTGGSGCSSPRFFHIREVNGSPLGFIWSWPWRWPHSSDGNFLGFFW